MMEAESLFSQLTNEMQVCLSNCSCEAAFSLAYKFAARIFLKCVDLRSLGRIKRKTKMRTRLTADQIEHLSCERVKSLIKSSEDRFMIQLAH